jgi:membrane protease YdiL (CAAX protease family)
MTLAAAALWVTGVTVLFLAIATAAVSLRASAGRDVFAQVCCQIAAYSLGLFGLLRVYGPDMRIRSFIALRRTHVAFYPLALALGVAVALPANLLFELSHQLFPQLDVPTDIAEAFFEASTGGKVTIGVAVLLAGPLVEEVFFRGALFGPLCRSHHAITVVMGTAAYFALVHLDPHAMLPILIVGVALGYLRTASGSLIPAVLLHVGFNAVPLFSMVFGQRPAPPGTAIETPIAPTVLSTAVAIALLLCVRYVSRLDASRVARGLDEQA